MCNCGRSSFNKIDETINEKVLLAVHFVLSIFGITKKEISTVERLLKVLIMIAVIGFLIIGSLIALGVL